MNKLKTTVTDFYFNYPYKKIDGEFTEGIYYIPKYELNDTHKFSITRQEYLKISNEFFKTLIFEYLLLGYTFKFPHFFGSILFKKVRNKEKNKGNIDFNETRRIYGEWNKNNPDNKKIVLHKNYHTQGYGVYIKWDKTDAKITNKYLMLFSLSKRIERQVGQKLRENPTLINYITE